MKLICRFRSRLLLGVRVLRIHFCCPRYGHCYQLGVYAIIRKLYNWFLYYCCAFSHSVFYMPKRTANSRQSYYTIYVLNYSCSQKFKREGIAVIIKAASLCMKWPVKDNDSKHDQCYAIVVLTSFRFAKRISSL